VVFVRQRQLLPRCDDQTLEGVPDGIRKVVGHRTHHALHVLGLGTNAFGPVCHGHEVFLEGDGFSWVNGSARDGVHTDCATIHVRVGDALVNKAPHLDVRGGGVNWVNIEGVGFGQFGVKAEHNTEGGHVCLVVSISRRVINLALT